MDHYDYDVTNTIIWFNLILRYSRHILFHYVKLILLHLMIP